MPPLHCMLLENIRKSNLFMTFALYLLKTTESGKPVCNENDRFRTFDGSCNNLEVPKYGQALTPVQRVLPNAYADNYIRPRRAKNGRPLPPARFVSTELTSGVSHFITFDFQGFLEKLIYVILNFFII